MNWSIDPPQAPASPFSCVAPASEHIPSPHVPLHNKGSNGKNRAVSTTPSILDYGEEQLAITSS